jgi:tripartite ATP-independent transporter DctP family solute receptor
MTTSLRRRPSAWLATLAASLLLAAPALAQEKVRIAGNFTDKHTSSIAIEQFRKDVEQATGGKLLVETFPNMQLGGAKENVDAVRSGTLAITWVGAAFLSRIVPELEAVSLPFVFPTAMPPSASSTARSAPPSTRSCRTRASSALGWMELGMRHVTNSKRPIRTMADLKGLKIRLQPNETHLATFRALGANPVAMDVKELYSALEQRVVDGQENPYTVIGASRFSEVQKQLSNTGHFFDFIAVVASKKAFEQLKPEHQKAVRDRDDRHHRLPAQAGRRGRGQAPGRAQGKMTYTEVTPPRARRCARPRCGVVEDVKKRAGADLVNQVLAEGAKPWPAGHPDGPGAAPPHLPPAGVAAAPARPGRPLAVTGLVLAAMATMVPWCRCRWLLRYGLNRSFDWADEIGRMGSSGRCSWPSRWASAMGRTSASTCWWTRCRRRPPTSCCAAPAALLAAVMMALIAWAAVLVAVEQWDELMSTVDLSAAGSSCRWRWAARCRRCTCCASPCRARRDDRTGSAE